MQLPGIAEVKKYLLEFDVYPGAPQEAINYLNSAIHRFMITLSMVPPGGAGQRLLELGAGPYFITLLLKRYRSYELELANFFGDNFPAVSEQTVQNPQRGEAHVFRYHNFNCERDAFPYADASFDVLLCCEILEHLTVDPTHLLCEAHRVLKPGGLLLVTTPNVFNVVYALNLLRGSHNLFHPYSGYGVYGRHQREYTEGELSDLLQGVGYDIVESRVQDIHPSPLRLALLKRLRQRWRDNLFVLARKTGERRYYYPPHLYISTHAIRRVVNSDMRIGWNDVGHLGLGWWTVEQANGSTYRWTTREAQAFLVRPAGARCVKVELNSGPAQWGSVNLEVEVEGAESLQTTLTPETWHEIVMPLTPSPGSQVAVTLSVDHTRNPAALHMGSDSRDLGVMVRRISVEAD